jgi:flagellar hook-associated protein 1 FlgK
VSIDEEMINLIKYQMGYNAAGKLVKTTNDMLDTLMGLLT